MCYQKPEQCYYPEYNLNSCLVKVFYARTIIRDSQVNNISYTWLISIMIMILYHVYTVALRITKLKKPHNIGETLGKPCLLKCAKLVLGDTAYNKLKQISLSDNTIQRRIAEMSGDIKTQLFSSLRSSQFAIQLDESTDVSNVSITCLRPLY